MHKKGISNECWKKIWIISLVILMIAVLVFCLIANYFGTNTATMISGSLSAFATAILGSIAIWQNVQYKKQSDDFHNIAMRPYITIFDSNKNGDAEEIKIKCSDDTCFKNMRIQNVGRESILEIEIEKYTINGNNFDANITTENTMLTPKEIKIFHLPFLDSKAQSLELDFLIKNVLGEEYIVIYTLMIDENGKCKKSLITKVSREEQE